MAVDAPTLEIGAVAAVMTPVDAAATAVGGLVGTGRPIEKLPRGKSPLPVGSSAIGVYVTRGSLLARVKYVVSTTSAESGAAARLATSGNTNHVVRKP